MINHGSLRPIHKVNRANRVRGWFRNGGHGEKVWVEVLVKGGTVSEDLTKRSDWALGGPNDGANQLIVW